MDIDQMFPSKYIAATDLQGRETTATIKAIESGDFRGEKRWYVSFVGKQKLCPVNKTRATVLSTLFGSSDNWPGQVIGIRAAWTKFGGDNVQTIEFFNPAVRTHLPQHAMPPQATTPPPQAAAAPTTTADEYAAATGGSAAQANPEFQDDDIPF